MAVLVDKNTRLIVQGITGKEGTFHAKGVPKKSTAPWSLAASAARQRWHHHEGWPVFNTVAEAVEKTGANATVIRVPPPFAADAILEAEDACIPLIVAITEGIPTLDMVKVRSKLKTSKSRLIGPNRSGRDLTLAKRRSASCRRVFTRKAPSASSPRSNASTYEAVHQLTQRGIGQSTAIGIGGDPIIGTTHIDALRLLNDDPETEAIIMIGEIGGSAEEAAADFVKKNVKKPVATEEPADCDRCLRGVAWAMPEPSSAAAREPRRTK